MKKIKGLRRRWIINTVSIVCVLGLICVLGVTAAFASYYYSAMESDMRYRARTTTEFFSEYINLSYNEYYQSCIAYAQGFEDMLRRKPDTRAIKELIKWQPEHDLTDIIRDVASDIRRG